MQFYGLIRDTWWLWFSLLIATGLAAYFISFLMLITLPVLLVSFIYFALIRYDDKGNEKSDF